MNNEILQYLKEKYPNMSYWKIAGPIGVGPNIFLDMKRPIGLRNAVKLAKATGRPIMDFGHK